MAFDLLVTFHGNSVVVVWCSLFTPVSLEVKVTT